jgi:hypothetical protein
LEITGTAGAASSIRQDDFQSSARTLAKHYRRCDDSRNKHPKSLVREMLPPVDRSIFMNERLAWYAREMNLRKVAVGIL